MPAARATALPGFFRPSRNRFVFDSLVANEDGLAGAESAGQRPQPVVVCHSSTHKSGNHFCTILLGRGEKHLKFMKSQISNPVRTSEKRSVRQTVSASHSQPRHPALIRTYRKLSVIFDFFRVRFPMILPPMILPLPHLPAPIRRHRKPCICRFMGTR